MCSVLFHAPIYAQTPQAKAKKKKPPAEKPSFAEKTLEGANKAADQIAETIDQTAENIDVRLAGKKYTKKKNASSVSVKQLTVWREGGDLNNSTSFGINIRLPNLERRWQVRFSSYDEEEEQRDQQAKRFRTRPRENNPGAALLFFKRLGKIKTVFQPRLEIKDPLAMSYILRFESDAGTERFRINPRADFFAHPEYGTGQYFRLNFSFNLAERWELTLINDEEYRERTNFLNVNHGVSLDHALSDDKGVAFSVIANSVNLGGGYHLNQYTFSPAYAQELAEDRLRFVLATFLAFGKGEAFKGDAGCSLQVEVIF